MHVLAHDLIVKNYVDVCTNTDDLVKNHVDVCTSKDDLVKIYVYVCTKENDSDSDIDDDDSDIDIDDDDDKPGTSGNNKPSKNDDKDKDNKDNKLSKNDNNNKDNTDNNEDNKDSNEDNKDSNEDNKDNNKPVNNEESHQISPIELFSNNITKIIKLDDELKNYEIYDDDEWLVFMQLNKINPLLDELIDHSWLNIYNKNGEKNEVINIDVDIDKHKDIKVM